MKRKIVFVAASALLAWSGMVLMGTPVRADQPISTAPPVDQKGSTSADSVFNWKDVPQNEKVTITRATFDSGGYQLYDTAGETIIVPFASDNLYVMKFARTDSARMTFINDGSAPVLYVPEGVYLENAAVPGARWYPFTPDYHPAEPVYLGIAPSWNDYVVMGWYPGMICYAGYYCDRPWSEGIIVAPCSGFEIVFGDHLFHGWAAFDFYCGRYPAPYHLGIFNHEYYAYGGRPWGTWHGDRPMGDRVFRGGRGFSDHGFAGRDDHGFAGRDDHGFSGDRGVSRTSGGHGFIGDRGVAGRDDHGYNGDRGVSRDSGGHGFIGDRGVAGRDDHAFSGGGDHGVSAGRDSSGFSGRGFSGGDDHGVGAGRSSSAFSGRGFGGDRGSSTGSVIGDHGFGGVSGSSGGFFGDHGFSGSADHGFGGSGGGGFSGGRGGFGGGGGFGGHSGFGR
ncbi:MAG: hypothetical protein P4L33_11535 [Capsulimonadaceae bacterium]|nr:hypothetical protein [Capsulimonadaceae bacterium]